MRDDLSSSSERGMLLGNIRRPNTPATMISKITTVTEPHIFQKYVSFLVVSMIPCKFMPKYEVKNDSGRKTTVTPVKIRIALF